MNYFTTFLKISSLITLSIVLLTTPITGGPDRVEKPSEAAQGTLRVTPPKTKSINSPARSTYSRSLPGATDTVQNNTISPVQQSVPSLQATTSLQSSLAPAIEPSVDQVAPIESNAPVLLPPQPELKPSSQTSIDPCTCPIGVDCLDVVRC